ncbi:DUF1707 SHOCT-like domain-containing protein [Nocardioides zeae]|uniref:DUF1707 domain-containing protein n=1 Tax=Nocardioides zeae TaxID=1457234 RepID=A0A6P0HK41_9ACTN|nr:DUF1707 domain-containing protein [Nocardioides zeae]NEN78983.1 DUF1707 domain-containing protein [Nocardioides zeae]
MTTDPSQLRISDADRHKVAELLQGAAGEGRLETDELEERLEATYAAKIYADLVPIVADIPGEAPTSPGMPVAPYGVSGMPTRPAGPAGPAPVSFEKTATGASVPAVHYPSSVAIMGGVERKGIWEIGATHTVFTLMGGAEIDLREARFAQREVTIHANALMGGVEIAVNAWTHVIVDGVGIMGGFAQERDKVEAQLDQNSPIVRVKGVALMGGVSVVRKPMPGERKRKRKPLGGR